jgi:dihydrofolate reductase
MVHITLAYVASLNGKITKGDNSDVHEWSSAEDWKHFERLRDEYEVIIIDRKTYEAVRPPAEQGKLRIVFTSTPERIQAVPEQLEFVDESPAALVKRLSRKGYKKVLIAGGARLSGSFLKAGLVDDVYISFEPVLFGSGRPMIVGDAIDVALRLQSYERLNDQGTLLAHYTVIKNN